MKIPQRTSIGKTLPRRLFKNIYDTRCLSFKQAIHSLNNYIPQRIQTLYTEHFHGRLSNIDINPHTTREILPQTISPPEEAEKLVNHFLKAHQPSPPQQRGRRGSRLLHFLSPHNSIVSTTSHQSAYTSWLPSRPHPSLRNTPRIKFL